MFRKKVNTVVTSLLSFVALTIGALMGFAYIQFWSASTHKKIVVNEQLWKNLAKKASDKEFDFFKDKILNSKFVNDATESLKELPFIKIDGTTKWGLGYLFDKTHFKEQGALNLNGIYNFSQLKKNFSGFVFHYIVYSAINEKINNEIDKINFFPSAIKIDLKKFFIYENIDNLLKYLASIYPNNFYLYINSTFGNPFNLQKIILNFLEINKLLPNNNFFSHDDTKINVTLKMDFTSLKDAITIKNNEQKIVNYPEIIDNKFFSLLIFFAYNFDYNYNLSTKVNKSDQLNIVWKF